MRCTHAAESVKTNAFECGRSRGRSEGDNCNGASHCGFWKVRSFLAAAGIAIVLVLGVIIRVASDVGDVEIEIADDIADEITVNILLNGEPAIEGWTVSSSGETRRIATGLISVD